MITETTGLLSPIAENIPEELKVRPQWLVWRAERRDGQWKKVPYTPGTDLRASVTDLMSWSTFEHAWGSYEDSDGRYAGVGFVLASCDPYVLIDLDRCRRPATGEVAPWAQEIIGRVKCGYIEVSVGGCGIHIVVEGKVRGGGLRRGSVEMYGRDRYCAITGVIL